MGKKPEKQIHVVHCANCEKHVKAFIEGQYEYFDDYESGPIRFTLLHCSVCESPMLGRSVYFFDDDLRDWVPLEPELIYPEPHRQLGIDVPPFVKASYEEAVRCFSVQGYVASSIMCRRTLEAVVNELLNGSKSLSKGIGELKTKGLIDPQLVEWADALRVSGNKAAHEVGERVNKQDARDLLEFAHALIEYVFTYRRKFDEFKKRLKNREAALKKAIANKAVGTAPEPASPSASE